MENYMNINHDPDISNLTHSRTGQALQNLNSNKANLRPAQENAASSLAAGMQNGFALSIGNGPENGGIFDDSDRTDDFTRALAAGDVEIRKDYMSVMSLSMSEEDYAEMVRTGRAPEDMDVTDTVTILDHIKTAMIRGGADVAGYTDDIDIGTLARITGSVASAELLTEAMHAQDMTVNEENARMITDAVRKAESVLPLSDEAAGNLISGGQAPTIENIYHASHSGVPLSGGSGYINAGGYLGRTAGSGDIDELLPQIEETIERSGLEVDDRSLNEAKWLISHNLPLTPETLLELDSLEELRNGMEKEALINAAAIAISAGIPGEKANLTYERSIFTEAEDLAEEIGNMPDEAADLVAEKGQLLNIRNLRQASIQIQMSVTAVSVSVSADTKTRSTEDLQAEQLHARRVLEEARLNMSTQAVRMLLRNNYRMDLAPMEELVDSLKAAESAISQRLFPGEDDEVSMSKAAEYRDVNDTLDDIFGAPAAILGSYKAQTTVFAFSAEVSYTLNEVYESGVSRRNDYIRAGETYEALMTAPRADLGDSVKKAFRNVDDILEDMNLETDELNRRAVRILGYNSMEITPENVEQVRESDIMLRGVLNRLTPDRVLNMIREDVNPLNMPVQELGEYLDGRDSEPEKQAQDYARFLMQLERQNEITELERDSYIGIYRMISKLDRTDDAALGRLMAMGSEISFSTLLSAMRSSARTGMDYTVDDSFGGVDPGMRGKAIDVQINAAFSGGEAVDAGYFSMENMTDPAAVSEAVIENLLNSGNAVSPGNIEALDAIRNKRGDWARPIADRLKSRAGDSDRSGNAVTEDSVRSIEERVDEVLTEMTDRASALDSYLSMLDAFKSDISEAVYDSSELLDIRTMQMSMKQIGLLGSFARDEVYDLPVEMDGELTSIRLTMRHESGAGRVAVSLVTETIGTVAAEFSFSGKASGYVAYESAEAGERLSRNIDAFTEALGFEPGLIRTAHIDTAKYTDRFGGSEKNKKDVKEDGETTDINNIELYRAAADFIRILKKI